VSVGWALIALPKEIAGEWRRNEVEQQGKKIGELGNEFAGQQSENLGLKATNDDWVLFCSQSE
jgi:hypothetical protein